MAGTQNRRTQDGERIVDMYDIGSVPANRSGQGTPNLAVPDHLGWEQGPIEGGPVLDVVVQAFKAFHLVAVGF
jgi:hypothetical protein